MSEITEIPKCNCYSHNNRVCDVCQIYIPEIDRLKEENDRYRNALEKYADANNYYVDDYDNWCIDNTGLLFDGPELAREALEGQGD